MYAEILRQERLELGKKAQVDWTRVLEIRHLKDRMIRKSQRLSNATEIRRVGRGQQFKFQSVVAPPEFRLKEMERWIRTNHIGSSQVAPAASTSRSAPVTKVYSANTSHTTLRHRPSSSSTSNPCRCCSRPAHGTTVSSKVAYHRLSQYRPSSRSSRLIEEEIEIVEEPEEMTEEERPERPSSVASFARAATPPNLVRQTDSPDPLPIKINEHVRHSSHGSDELVARPTLPRTRSSLKGRKAADAAKTVSWADNKPWLEQVGKYSTLAQEAFESGLSIHPPCFNCRFLTVYR